MSGSVSPTSDPSQDDDALANGYYMQGLEGKGDNNYINNRGDVLAAIKKELENEQGLIAKGGHVSMGETMLLMYLMQGFGGDTVGMDGMASSALKNVQNDMAAAWQTANECSSGKYNPPTTPEQRKALLSKLRKDGFDVSSGTPNGTLVFYGHLDDALSLLGSKKMKQLIPKAELDQMTSSIKDVMHYLSSGNIPGAGDDPLARIYQLAHPSDPKTQGDPEYLDSFTRLMTTVNQQVTGASQIMSTQAKADSKTQQSEGTAFNNYMQMIKKMLSYFVQLQRTN